MSGIVQHISTLTQPLSGRLPLQ